MNAEKEANSAKDILDNLVSRISELEDDLKDAQDENEELEGQITELKGKISDMENDFIVEDPGPSSKDNTLTNYKIH